MPMKKFIILLLTATALVACKQAEDTRYFAPEVSFEAEAYTVPSSDGGVDVVLNFSRPATVAFQIKLVFSGTLQEGLQYTVPSHVLNVAAGDTQAKLHVTLVDDEIWDKSLFLDLLITPGDRYTVNTAKYCATRVNVTKLVVIPVLSLSVAEADREVNPYLAPEVTLTLSADKAPLTDITVPLAVEGLTIGEDFLLDGGTVAAITLPADQQSATCQVKILKKDQSGYDQTLQLSMSSEPGKYGVSTEGASVSIRSYDPVVDFKPVFQTAASNGGAGYAFRQAIQKADESWDGNTTVDMGVSSEGSNYLRNYRNMFDHPSFGCRANASVSQFLRMSELFPNYLYPNKTAILDYGNDQGHREFSPADSLMRFVLAPGETQRGTIHLEKPRSFKAYIGSYDAWQDKSSGSNAWVKDSKATGGDIDASTHPAITGSVWVTLEKLEGTFDFTASDAQIVLTAWFSSNSDQFLKADTDDSHPSVADPVSTWDIVQEDGLWKVNYKMWPR